MSTHCPVSVNLDRHLSADESDAWMTTAPAGDPIAFGERFALRVSSGGYVTAPDAGVYVFPLSMIDLKDGNDKPLLLRVPYTGKLPEPTTNFRRSQSPEGKDRWHTLGPHVLAITGLQTADKHVRVTLGMERWARIVEFDMEDLHERKQK